MEVQKCKNVKPARWGHHPHCHRRHHCRRFRPLVVTVVASPSSRGCRRCRRGRSHCYGRSRHRSRCYRRGRTDRPIFFSLFEQVGGAGLLLLYGMRCVIGTWVHRIPAENRAGVHNTLMPGLGASIVVLSFFETWLSLVSAGRRTHVWSTLLYVSFIPLFQEWAES